MLPGDDAMRVERLLESIAEQSHYEQRYQIRAEIARGGMGQVYHAYDTILRRDVAIKMMREGYGGEARSSALRGQFLKEARVGGRLLHPNILAVFDLGVNRAGQIYYTMRLVDGASLQHSLDSVDKGVVTKLITYPLRRVVEAFVGACHGVDYAHQQGVIHLDLKPQNILVSGFNEVFVIDWGLARVDEIDDTEVLVDLYRERCGGNTGSNTGVFGNRVVGTPGYMAPEQTTGEVAAFGPATDVYGLGGVLHFILYGAPPNRGRDPLERMRATAERKARGKLRSGILARGQRVRKEASAALEALEAVCLKALEPHPPERYPDVEAMIVELSEWLASTPGPPAGV
jgi:serine/threonine-protein kinase